MARSVCSLLLAPALLLIACASPEFPENGKTNNGTGKAPPVDLAGFVTQAPDDLSQSIAADMAKATASDLASAPKDMATAPHDLATPGGCGTITYDGICSGDNLIYCNAGMLVTINCWDAGYFTCESIGGVADCYF